MAQCRDLGRDFSGGIDRPTKQNSPAWEAFHDCCQNGLERLEVAIKALDNEVGQHNACKVGILKLGTADLRGGRPP